MNNGKDAIFICLKDQPELLDKASHWFHSKWGVPLAEYRTSMKESLMQKSKIPRWYLVLNTKQEIVAGAGIIENDFHDRKDLTPNLCALFVEPEYRNNGIARSILDFERKDAGKAGFSTLYLITDHTTFYEKCGWSFLTMANDSSGPVRVYAAPTIT